MLREVRGFALLQKKNQTPPPKTPTRNPETQAALHLKYESGTASPPLLGPVALKTAV